MNGTSVRPLLRAYLGALDESHAYKAVFFPERGASRSQPRTRLPVARRLLSYAVVQHVERTTVALARRYAANAAVADDPGPARAQLETLATFSQSIPSLPTRRLLSVGFIAVVLLAFLLARFVFGSAEHAQGLANVLEALVTLDRHGLVDATTSFGPNQAAGAVFITAASLWLVIALPGAAYRYKRELLEPLRDLEDSAFIGVGTPRPRDVRVDIAADLAFLSLPAWLAIIFFSFATIVVTGGAGAFSTRIEAVPFFAAGVAILGWAALKARAIAGGRAGVASPRLAGLRNASNGTLFVGAAVAFVFVLFPCLVEDDRPSEVRLSSFELQPNVSRGDYLDAVGVPRAARTGLSRNGVVLKLHAQLSGSRRNRTRWTILDAAKSKPIPGARGLGPTFGTPLTAIESHRGADSARTSSLLLLNFSDLKRNVRCGVTSLSARASLWVPVPERTGPVFIKVEIINEDEGVLDSARTKRLTIAQL